MKIEGVVELTAKPRARDVARLMDDRWMTGGGDATRLMGTATYHRRISRAGSE